jgi:hypothetical protein
MAMNLPRTLVAIAMTALLVVTAAACGDDDDAASDTTESESTARDSGAPSGSDPTDCPPEPTDESASALVGLTEDEATEAAEACGWILRVVRRDGEDLPATRDFRPNRVNVEVTDGEVTAIVNTG